MLWNNAMTGFHLFMKLMNLAHHCDIAEVRIWDLNGISEVLCMYFKAGNLVYESTSQSTILQLIVIV